MKLCRKLGLEKAAGCSKVINQSTFVTITYDIFMFIIAVVAIVIVGLTVVKCYKKSLKKDMQK